MQNNYSKSGKLINGNFPKVSFQAKEIIPIPLALCRELLNKSGLFYTDEEIENIRTYLYDLAAMVYLATEQQQVKVISMNEHKTATNEECDYLRTG